MAELGVDRHTGTMDGGSHASERRASPREAAVGSTDAPGATDATDPAPAGRPGEHGAADLVRPDALGLVLFSGMALLVAIDVIADLGGLPHAALESLVMLLAGVGVFVLLRRFRRERRALREAMALAEASAARAQADSARAYEEAARWREEARDALRGLSAAIDRQFDRWQLSPAERDVGLLLLKGLSHKEVAVVLDKSERTVRQQSLAIYKKSGLAGRAELSAFFLEDLLLPPTTETMTGTKTKRPSR